MNTDPKTVEERQQRRYRLLKTIYDEAGDSTSEGAHFAEVFRKAGFEEHDEEGHDILEYLMQKGLLSNRTGIGWLALSHKGLAEIERSILHPEERTEHFRPGVVQRFYAAVGVVQNAADSVARVEQNNEGAGRALGDDQRLIAERQERRRRMMRRIYEKSEGTVNKHVVYDEVQAEEGLSEIDFWAVMDYLTEEGLVDDSYSGGVFNITQRGIEYAERQIRHPHAQDDLAPGQGEQHFYGPVGAVQNAPGSTAYVTQNNAAINSAELVSLVRELRAKLEALPESEEALQHVEDLEEEVNSPSPKPSRIKAAAKYIGTVVKDVGVSVIADAISKAAGGV